MLNGEMNVLTFGGPADVFHPGRVSKTKPASTLPKRQISLVALQNSESVLIKPKMPEAEEQREISSQFPTTERSVRGGGTALVMQRGCWQTRATSFNEAVPVQTEGDASKSSFWLKEGAISLVEQRVSHSQVTEALPPTEAIYISAALTNKLGVLQLSGGIIRVEEVRNNNCTQHR